MRKPYPSYSLLTLGGLFLAGSCSIIAEVDRTKIPTDGGTTPEGGQGSGGTNGTGGSKGGSAGAGGNTGGSAGTSGEGGMGGEPGGMGGEDSGGAGSGGMAGMGGEPPIPVCGDGAIDVGIGEECDDEDDPPAGSDGCSATCQEEPGWTCTMTPSVCVATACGDRIVAGAEMCDDGNNNACGTCSVGCGTSTAAAAAAGSVTPQTAATLPDGTTFVLNDGFNPAITFEFDSDDSVTANTATLIAIDYTTATTDLDLRAAILAAVNGVAGTLLITASNGTAPAVTLTHDRLSSLGNIAITPSSGVTVVGMTGGLAGNCPSGTGCNVNADCASNDCGSTNVCAP